MVGFYIFMFVCTLLIPAAMLFFGYRWQNHAPDKVNSFYGYRSKRSMSSKKAWDFAHAFFGKLWIRSGWVTAVVSTAMMVTLAFITLEVAVVGSVGGVIVLLQLIPMLVPMYLTEQALKNEFGL